MEMESWERLWSRAPLGDSSKSWTAGGAVRVYVFAENMSFDLKMRLRCALSNVSTLNSVRTRTRDKGCGEATLMGG